MPTCVRFLLQSWSTLHPFHCLWSILPPMLVVLWNFYPHDPTQRIDPSPLILSMYTIYLRRPLLRWNSCRTRLGTLLCHSRHSCVAVRSTFFHPMNRRRLTKKKKEKRKNSLWFSLCIGKKEQPDTEKLGGHNSCWHSYHCQRWHRHFVLPMLNMLLSIHVLGCPQHCLPAVLGNLP